MGKESITYENGQQVQINIGSVARPEWADAKVINTDPKTTGRTRRIAEKIFGLKPIAVEIDSQAHAWSGRRFKLYEKGINIRPK